LLAFEIYKNGRKIALAGLEDSGAVSLMLTWIGKGPGASRKAAQGFAIDGLDLRVGGIDTSDPAGKQSIEWIDDAAFALGDELHIRLVSTEAVDTPMRRESAASIISGDSGDQKFVACPICGAVRHHAGSQIVACA